MQQSLLTLIYLFSIGISFKPSGHDDSEYVFKNYLPYLWTENLRQNNFP